MSNVTISWNKFIQIVHSNETQHGAFSHRNEDEKKFNIAISSMAVNAEEGPHHRHMHHRNVSEAS